MPEPIVAVDPGTAQTSAALVVGEQWRLVTAPVGDGDAAFPELLASIRDEAGRRYGGRIQRLALAAPAGQDGALLAAATAAGFRDVELVPEPVAAALDPAGEADHAPGDNLLVCHLGAAGWRAALVRVAGDHTAVLSEQVSPEPPPELADRLRWLVDSCLRLAGETGRAPAATVLAGGWAGHRGVFDRLRAALPGRVRMAADPEQAVLRGVVRWAAGAGRRRVLSEPPRWRVEPVSWRIPDQDARVVRWLVGEGRPFAAGTVLARIRTRADRVYELTAATDGALLSHRIGAGERTGPTLVAAVAPAVGAAAYDPPPHRHQWSTTGGWLLTTRLLVEWDGTGGYVHTRDLADGAVAGALQPEHGSDLPQRAGVFVDPAGRFCLLSWRLDGQFWVWDIAAASLRARFTGPAGVRQILVNEGQWRLAAEVPDSVTVGRYRRTAVVFWDLETGQRIDKLIADDWERSHPGYVPRSATDRLTGDTASPDGRLRAVVEDGGVTLYETATDRPVFRAPQHPDHHVRTAFSADGRFLLATRETDDRSTIDVWQL